MRIVACPPLYPPGSLVGSWLTTHEFLTHLVGRGHQIDVVPTQAAPADPYNFDGVHVHPGGTPELGHPDLVVFHLGDNGFGRRFFPHLPHVAMVHGENRDMAAQLDGCALAVFNSDATAAAAGWDGPQIVAHPPLSIEPVDPGDRVTMINLAEKKGGDLFGRMVKTMPHTRFLGVRGGYGRQVIRRARNLEVLVPTSDMAEIYGRTRILVVPSLTESWGRVGLEAMTCGIPVIASSTPGLLESLGEAGIFVNGRNNLSGWRRAIRALEDPDRWQEASDRARAHAASFDRQAQLDRFTTAVEALVPVAA